MFKSLWPILSLSPPLLFSLYTNMSSSSDDGGSRVSIPADLLKTIQNIREVTGKQHSDEDIFSVFKDCFNDPHETTQKLLYLGSFCLQGISIFFYCFCSIFLLSVLLLGFCLIFVLYVMLPSNALDLFWCYFSVCFVFPICNFYEISIWYNRSGNVQIRNLFYWYGICRIWVHY